jgi:pimeloyl-ACP methyl ester carboxylesterase/DNA-binding CsgD family transcriptional regulator
METYPVRYTRTSDGWSIAYCAGGDGETLVFVPALFGYVNLGWDLYPSWFKGFAEGFHFVHYDGRGTGLSARGLGQGHRIEDWQRDLEAVMDASGSDRAVLFAGCHAGHVAVRYTLEHPERVRALVLDTVSIEQKAWGPAFWTEVSRESWGFFLHAISPEDVSPAERIRIAAALGESMTPEDMNVSTRSMFSSTLADEAVRVKTPTLILHPRTYAMLPAVEGARLASVVPSSQFVLIGGEYLYGDGEEGIGIVKDFLSRLPEEAAPFGEGGDGLSTREVEVLRLLATGRSNQQIADELVISLNTVRRHVSNVFDKIGVANRAQATAYAKDHGIA